MTARRPKRQPGTRWRTLAHTIRGGRAIEDSWHQHDDSVFDELVIDRWYHLEQMTDTRWWMNIAGVTVWVHVNRDGRATSVSVYGPGDYDLPEADTTYSATWTRDFANDDGAGE